MSDLKLFNQTLQHPRTQEYLDSVLGAKKSSFVNNIVAVVGGDKKLQACEPMTLLYAAIKATALDLPIDQNIGFAYLIPYNNKRAGTSEAQFQLGYKGIVQLAIRSKQFRRINVTDVREGELVSRDRRTGALFFKWIEDDKERKAAPIIGYLGYFQLTNGYEKESYWTVEELQAHGVRYSQTYGSQNKAVREQSKWFTDFDVMAKKTVLKLMLNKGDAPLSVEMMDAIKYDQSVITDADGSYKYVDNTKPTAADLASQALSQEAVEEAVAEDVTQEQSPELFNDGAEQANE